MDARAGCIGLCIILAIIAYLFLYDFIVGKEK